MAFPGSFSRSYQDLSKPDPEWEKVAGQQAELEPLIDKIYDLPIEEFRKLPYRPPPLPDNAPKPDQDIKIMESECLTRDGATIKLRLYEPINRGRKHLLFFNIHGGGWTVGVPETEEAQNRFIAAECSAVICSVDYRRAPEFPFPYPLHDSLDALLWCIKSHDALGIDPERIIVGGGSAGANIAAVISQMSREEGITGIIGQVLNIPVTCHPDHFPTDKYEFRSYEQNAHAPIVSASRMKFFWRNYLPQAQFEPQASPLLAVSLKDLPKTLVQVAGMDPLRDEGLAYAQEMRNAGVDVTLEIYPGMPHAFYVYPHLQQSVMYFRTMVDWINEFQAILG